MTTDEKLDFLISEFAEMKQDIGGMKQDINGMKQDIDGMKQDINGMKQRMDGMQHEIDGLKQEVGGLKQEVGSLKQEVKDLSYRVMRIEIHLEEVTDRNIQILAENFTDFNAKLNRVIGMAERNFENKIKVNYLVEKVRNHEEELQVLKRA